MKNLSVDRSYTGELMLCVALTQARDYHITQTDMEPVNSSRRTLSFLKFHWAKKKCGCPVVRMSGSGTTKARTTHFFEPNARGARSCPVTHLIRLETPSASLSFIGACCVVDGSARVWGILAPNLTRTCASEALGNISFCSFSTNCRVD